jgi:hypothetical protein
MKSKSFIVLLFVFVLFIGGVVVFYRYQLMLGGVNSNAVLLPKNFVNPFVVAAGRKDQAFENPFAEPIYQNPFDPDTYKSYKNPFSD